MANSVHTDSSGSTGLATGQTPIVLARLPRVGAATPTPATPQPVPPPEVMPQLELRAEIEQRTHLHIANTPTDEQVPSPSHFADREHAVDHESKVRHPATVRMPLPEPASQYESRRYDSTLRTQKRAAGKPATFSEKLFQVHAQLAPHAGLIVALALIASAGLLYWMIVGPTASSTPGGYDSFSENYEQRQQDKGFRAASSDTYELTVDAFHVDGPANTPDQWTRVPLPELPPELPHSDQASSLILPTVEPTASSETSTGSSSTVGELHFQSSHSPHALDFTKVGPVTSTQTATPAVQPFPQVAELPTNSTIR